MRIVADENIPLVREAFGGCGDVVTAPGRGITGETLQGADALLVRSVTKVDEALLDGTPVQFVATATIGEDHIDKGYLASRGIGFSSAPGCNANSVAEYITAALLVLARERGYDLTEKRLGIVGAGHVGSQVAQKAAALGMEVVLNDPPLAETTGDDRYRPIDEIFGCDLVTLHVPLVRTGAHRTVGMVDAAFIQNMRRGAVLLNTSRGDVADGDVLCAALEEGHLGAAVLDVWEHEPAIDPRLMANCALATPHIAGYSYDGKVNGTRQIREAFGTHFAIAGTWDPSPLFPAPTLPELAVATEGQEGLREAVLSVYDIEKDDRSLRELARLARTEHGPHFDGLRRTYWRRFEFSHTRVTAPPSLQGPLTALGFTVQVS